MRQLVPKETATSSPQTPGADHHPADNLFPTPATTCNSNCPPTHPPPCYRQIGMANATASRKPVKNVIPAATPKIRPNPTENKIVTTTNGSAPPARPSPRATPGPAQSCTSLSCLKNLRSRSSLTPAIRLLTVGMANARASRRYGWHAGNGVPIGSPTKHPNPTETKIVISENGSALPKPWMPKSCPIMHNTDLSQKTGATPIQ